MNSEIYAQLSHDVYIVRNCLVVTLHINLHKDERQTLVFKMLRTQMTELQLQYKLLCY